MPQVAGAALPHVLLAVPPLDDTCVHSAPVALVARRATALDDKPRGSSHGTDTAAGQDQETGSCRRIGPATLVAVVEEQS